MIELVVVLGLLSPFLLMLWLWRSMRRTNARVREASGPESGLPRFESVDVLGSQDGLQMARRNPNEDEVIEPDPRAGEIDGIRSMQGRR